MGRILVFLVLFAGLGTARAGTIKGKVIQNGFRVAEYGVVLTWLGRTTAVRDGEGRFSITDVPAGKFPLVLVGWSFANVTMVVDVTETGTTDLGTFAVEQGRRITGHVVDTGGGPIVDATVLVFAHRPVVTDDPLDVMAEGARVATTGFDGRYVIDGVAADRELRIMALKDDLVSTEHLAGTPPRATFELVAARPGSIAGTIANPRALRSPVVSAEPVGYDGKRVLAGVNPRGEFRFELPAGVYDLTLGDEKLAPLQVVVVADRTTPARLAAPIAHADLIVAAGCMMVTLYGTRPNDRIARTEVATEVCEGDKVRFGDLPPGSYRVCIDGDDDCSALTVRASPRVQTFRPRPQPRPHH